MAIVGVTGASAELLSLVRSQQPEVLLVGEHLSDLAIGDLASRLRERSPQVRMLVIADLDAAHAQTLLKVGVQGLLSTAATGPEIVSAVQLIAKGKTVSDTKPLLWDYGESEHFSTTELKVLRLLLLGRRNADIAKELSRSGKTVEYHITHILAKLRVASRAQVIVKAQELGLATVAATDADRQGDVGVDNYQGPRGPVPSGGRLRQA